MSIRLSDVRLSFQEKLTDMVEEMVRHPVADGNLIAGQRFFDHLKDASAELERLRVSALIEEAMDERVAAAAGAGEGPA